VYIQVLEVATRELLMRNNFNLAITGLRDLNSVAEVSGAALDLDTVVEELLERLDVEDLVVDGLRAVDNELLGDLLALLAGRSTGTLLHECTLAYCSMSGSEGTAQPGGQQSDVRTVETIVKVGGGYMRGYVRAKKWLSCAGREVG
jgi:hypothetical protein